MSFGVLEEWFDTEQDFEYNVYGRVQIFCRYGWQSVL